MWKFLYFLGWVTIAVTSLFCIFLGIAPDYIDNIDFYDFDTRGIIIGVSLFLFILFIKKSSSVFEKAEIKITMEENTEGKIEITVFAIEEIVEGVFKEKDYIKELKLESRVKNNSLYIKARIAIESNGKFQEELKLLQENVVSRVQLLTGIKIAEIKVLVFDVRYI